MTLASVSVDPGRDAAGVRHAPRLLLVSPVAPVPEGVGGVYLRDLCLMYPPGHLAFAILPGIGHGAWPAPLDAAPRITLESVPERGFNKWGRRVQRSTRGVFDRYVDHRHLPTLVRQLSTFAATIRPDLLWVPLAGPTMINLAHRLTRALGLPLLTTVWDAPDYALPHYWDIQGTALDRLMGRFGAAIRASVRCAVASPAMKDAYEARYGTPCVSMIHGMPESDWLRPTGMRPRDEPFVLGYAGSLYARREWDALMQALDAVSWRVGGREVTVRVLAAGLDVRASGPARIEFLGWHSTTDALSLLSSCDACYVPYWFDDAFRPGVELSFPNKVSLYLAAGRPILFHGPRASTPTAFLDRWPVGVACHSLERDDIVAALRTVATDSGFHERAVTAIPQALKAELGMRVFRAQFAKFIGVDDAVLAPVPG